jgi:hypothetical protein
MLLTSRHLPGLALASAVTLIASIATAAPITLASPDATAALETRNELEAGIDGIDNGIVFSRAQTPGDPSAGIDPHAMDDVLAQAPLVVPEPASLVLTGLGFAVLAALAGRRWRRHSRHRHRRRLHWRT